MTHAPRPRSAPSRVFARRAFAPRTPPATGLPSPRMTAAPQLTLYGYWRSSSSHRVRIALALKGLSYRYEAVNLLTHEQSSEAHRARNPAGYVPVLVLDGVSYVESVAILELLEERFPTPPLLPSTPHGRARVRALVEMINSGVQPLQNLSVMRRHSSDAEAQKEWARHFIARGLTAFEAALERLEVHDAKATHADPGLAGPFGPFAYGDAPTLADVLLVPQVFAAKRFRVDLAPLPRVMRAFEAAQRMPEFQRAAPEAQPDAVPS